MSHSLISALIRIWAVDREILTNNHSTVLTGSSRRRFRQFMQSGERVPVAFDTDSTASAIPFVDVARHPAGSVRHRDCTLRRVPERAVENLYGSRNTWLSQNDRNSFNLDTYMAMTQTNEIETVYSPESLLRHPGRMLKEMFRDLVQSRELAWRLFVRDMNGLYRQSILGYLWLFVPTLVSMAVWVYLHSHGVVKFEKTIVAYPVFVVTGLVLWESFTGALQSPLIAVQNAASMLAKINFPREALFVSAFAQSAFQALARLLMLGIVLVVYQVPVTRGLMLVPLGLLSLLLLGFAIGILLLPLSMLFSDVTRILQVIVPIWFFITPVAYPLPENGHASVLAWCNPVSPVLNQTREWLTGQSASFTSGWCLVSIGTIGFVFSGWVICRVSMPHLIARLSA